jgi:hypothetical protein
LLIEDIHCDRERLEVVYPNHNRDDIRPITVEYVPLDSEADETGFAGDCYLISHRPIIDHAASQEINELHFFLAESNVDSVIEDLKHHFIELSENSNIGWKPNCIKKPGNGFVSAECSEEKRAFIDQEAQSSVFWHVTLPAYETELDNAITIFNSHQDTGVFRFDEDVDVTFVGSIGNVASPNYVLNSCSDAHENTIDEIVDRARYRNLIYANKEITSKEAAINLFCSIDEFLSIPDECTSMSDWVNEVNQCIQDQLGNDRHKVLAYHFIGQLDDVLCPNK